MDAVNKLNELAQVDFEKEWITVDLQRQTKLTRGEWFKARLMGRYDEQIEAIRMDKVAERVAGLVERAQLYPGTNRAIQVLMDKAVLHVNKHPEHVMLLQRLIQVRSGYFVEIDAAKVLEAARNRAPEAAWNLGKEGNRTVVPAQGQLRSLVEVLAFRLRNPGASDRELAIHLQARLGGGQEAELDLDGVGEELGLRWDEQISESNFTVDPQKKSQEVYSWMVGELIDRGFEGSFLFTYSDGIETGAMVIDVDPMRQRFGFFDPSRGGHAYQGLDAFREGFTSFLSNFAGKDFKFGIEFVKDGPQE